MSARIQRMSLIEDDDLIKSIQQASKVWSIEEYQSELGEKSVKIILEKLYNLKLKKIPKKKDQRTPDYEIKDMEDHVLAVCEVKSFIDIIEPIEPKEEVDYEKIEEESRRRDKNHRSKLRRHHGNALDQLADYKHLPTLIFFVSFDMTDYIDMGQVLQEYRELYPLDYMADLYALVKVHQAIIPSETFCVKQTIMLMNTTELGDIFGKTRLSLSEALRKAGILPMTFQIPG